MKLKVKNKDSRLLVKATISSDEIISTREIDIIQKSRTRGLLIPNVIGKRKIEFTGPNGISLYERLKSPVTQYEFLYIMSQIVDITRKTANNKLFVNNLILDIRYVFINEKTRELYFIYSPILSNHICVDIIGFMESVIYSSNPIREQNSDFISKYSRFLKTINEFDAERIDAYIQQEDRTFKKFDKGQSGFMTDKPKDYYDHYSAENDEDEATGLLDDSDDEATGLLDDTDEENTGLLNDDDNETGLLIDEDDDNATGLLVEDEVYGNQQVDNHYSSLYRILTDETIYINKPVFRIGKERSYVDYFVSNNNNVSRSHADLICRGSRTFIMDLNSKNHTYINGQMIQTRCEFELNDGDRIRLANEEFIFTK